MRKIRGVIMTRNKVGVRLKLLSVSLIPLSCVPGAAAAGSNTSDRGAAVTSSTGNKHSTPSYATCASRQSARIVGMNDAMSATDFKFNGPAGRGVKFGKRDMQARFTGSAEALQPAEQRDILPAQAGRDEPVGIRLFIRGF